MVAQVGPPTHTHLISVGNIVQPNVYPFAESIFPAPMYMQFFFWMKLLKAFTLLNCLHFIRACYLPPISMWKQEVDDDNFAWDKLHTEEDYLKRKEYIVKNNEIAGIKVWKCKMFLTVPRWKPGVPSTLNYINLPGNAVVSDPTLIPYPSWAQNKHKNCSSFQWVQSMEIDTNGVMWVLDKGATSAGGICPPKIVLLDLKNNGALY